MTLKRIAILIMMIMMTVTFIPVNSPGIYLAYAEEDTTNSEAEIATKEETSFEEQNDVASEQQDTVSEENKETAAEAKVEGTKAEEAKTEETKTKETKAKETKTEEKQDKPIKEDKKEKTSSEVKENTETVVEAKGKTFRIEATYDAASGIPAEGVRLYAKELKDDDPDAVTFDIKIVSDTDENVVYQPAEGHNVALTVVVLDKKADTDEDTTSVLHVREDGTEEMLTADLETTDEGYVYSFETGSFSTFTFYREGTNSNERFITTVKTGRFGGSQTELSGSERISNNDETGWLSFDEVIDKWNQDYTYSHSNGRYSVLKANDSGGGTRKQALCAIGFFEGYVGPARSHVTLGRYATSEDVNGSATSYDLQIELNDNSLPVKVTTNGTTTNKVFVPSGNATSFTPESIAAELGYDTYGMMVSGKINNMSVDSVSRAQLTTTDIPTVSSGTGWWTRLLAGESFEAGAGNTVIAFNAVSYPATKVEYPAAYKWTYNNGGTQTVIGDTPYEINMVPAVAQVSNDGGSTWKKFECLISGDYDGEPLEGAFNYANSLDGDVIIELLYDTHERYTLESGFNFNNTDINSLTINGVNEKSTLTKNQTSAPMITTTGIDEVVFNKIIFDGNDKITNNGHGGAVNTNALSLTVNNCEFNKCQAGKQGGGINHNNTDGAVAIANSTFTSCRANGPDDATGAGGGGVFTNAQTLEVTACSFENCSTKVRQGAGLFHKRMKTDPANSEATITNSQFKNCVAVWSGGGVESDAWNITIDNVEFTNCKATKGGGINVWADGQDSTPNETTLNITNCKFNDCTGTDNGGAVRSTSLHTNITDSTFEECSSNANGGAVACTSNKTITTVTGCTFTDCHADNAEKGLGGAIFAAGTVKNATTVSDTNITGCSARNGGAIRSANITLNNVTISACSATQQGGAVHSTQTITLKGGSITRCTTNGDSAAVEAETSTSGIVLSGDVVVSGNTGSSGEKRDVYIRYNSDRHILIATDGLGANADIGIYAPDKDSIYDNHGKPGKMFAWTGKYSGTPVASDYANLSKLFNDRTIGDMPILRGVAAVEGLENYKYRVMWEDYIARVSNDGGQTWTYHAYLVNAANSPTQQNGATVKEGAFDQASTLSGDVIIETLYETHPRYTVNRSTEFNKADTTYTLRTTQDSAWNPDGFTSTIYRGWNGNNNGGGAILHINNATTTFTTGDIILDGDKDGNVTGAAKIGYAIYVTNGSLSANGKTTVRNFNMTSNGGAVYAAGDLTYTVSDTGNLLFDNCSTTKNGGAIYAAKALTLTSEGTTTFTSCRANNGGGIYQNGTGDLTLTNVTFGKEGNADKGCFAEYEGGSIFSNSTNSTITDCSFYYSKAGSGANQNLTRGGAICHYGADGIKILGCEFDHCSANTQSRLQGYGNGGAVYVHDEATSLIVDKSDTRRSSFTNCSAYRYGGAVIMEKNGDCTLSISHSDFEDCSTEYKDGGAVYTDSNVTSFTDCTFKRCHSDSTTGEYNGGGAIYTNGDTPDISNTITINDCQFEDCYVKRNGGAIHFYATGTNATLNNVQIKGHNSRAAGPANAELGSGVYSRGNVTFKDCEITGCSASLENGGAVNVTSGKKMYFEGSTNISGNTNTSYDTGNEHNVVLDWNRDNNTTINTTTTGLNSNAKIGVYVTGAMGVPQAEPFKSHGDERDDFGTYVNSTGGKANLNRFINDRVKDDFGRPLYGEADPGRNYLIRWHMDEVAPTGFNSKFIPYVLLLIAGIIIVGISAFGRKKKKKADILHAECGEGVII